MIEVCIWLALCVSLVGVSIDSLLLLRGQREHYAVGSGPYELANLHIFLQFTQQVAAGLFIAAGLTSALTLLDLPEMYWSLLVIPGVTFRDVFPDYAIISGAGVWLVFAVVLNRYWHRHRERGAIREQPRETETA